MRRTRGALWRYDEYGQRWLSDEALPWALALMAALLALAAWVEGTAPVVA